jgi:membrane-associated phospholipid phosphatase
VKGDMAKATKQGVAPLSADVAPSWTMRWLAGALVVMDAALFLAIAEDVADGGGIISRDEAVLEWFVDHRTDALVSAAKLVSNLGSYAFLFGYSVVLVLWLWRRRGSSVLIAAAPLVTLLVAGPASTLAKNHYGRARPPVALQATTVKLSAFPSGHATDAAAFFLAAAIVLSLTVAPTRRMQLVYLAVGLCCAGLVGVSRLVLAVHWLSDVVAGWALGSAIALIIVTVAWWAATREEDPSEV